MTQQRSIEEAEAALDAARDQVVKEGGTISEVGTWDAVEAALDGAGTEVLVKFLNGTTTEAYKPKGGWAPTVGHN